MKVDKILPRCNALKRPHPTQFYSRGSVWSCPRLTPGSQSGPRPEWPPTCPRSTPREWIWNRPGVATPLLHKIIEELKRDWTRTAHPLQHTYYIGELKRNRTRTAILLPPTKHLLQRGVKTGQSQNSSPTIQNTYYIQELKRDRTNTDPCKTLTTKGVKTEQDQNSHPAHKTLSI